MSVEPKKTLHPNCDTVLAALLSPLLLPPAAVCAIVVGMLYAALPRRKARKATHTLVRFFETGPWGVYFDRLTWMPFSQDAARCVHVVAGAPPANVPCGDLPEPQPGTVRLVFCSDTHGKHRLLRLPAGHILCHTGDILSRNASVGLNSGKLTHRAVAALRDFNDWLSTTPFEHRVVIGGNHDAALELLGYMDVRSLLSNAHYLLETGVMLGGLQVWGTPWSPLGTSANRAFQGEAAPAFPPADLPIDVLLSHCHHAGLAATVAPRVFATGHAHEAHGVHVLRDGRVQLNASVCDGVYRAVQMPVVVDLAPR